MRRLLDAFNRHEPYSTIAVVTGCGVAGYYPAAVVFLLIRLAQACWALRKCRVEVPAVEIKPKSRVIPRAPEADKPGRFVISRDRSQIPPALLSALDANNSRIQMALKLGLTLHIPHDGSPVQYFTADAEPQRRKPSIRVINNKT